MIKLSHEEKIAGIQSLEKIAKENPAVLEHLKTLCFWAVQYVSQVQAHAPNKVIGKKLVDEYIEVEIGIIEPDQCFNPKTNGMDLIIKK